MTETILYYAYGSNMLKERISRSIPDAQRVGCGKLKNFQLVFQAYSDRWKGSVATIEPREGCDIWGVLWKITPEDLKQLDIQEIGYFRFEVEIEEPNGTLKKCYVYQMREHVIQTRSAQTGRLPSLVYLNTMINGAKESKLPESYIKYLQDLPHNEYNGEVNYNELY